MLIIKLVRQKKNGPESLIEKTFINDEYMNKRFM